MELRVCGVCSRCDLHDWIGGGVFPAPSVLSLRLSNRRDVEISHTIAFRMDAERHGGGGFDRGGLFVCFLMNLNLKSK